ncbi:imidazole glycerol phosphate synthase subunit HisF [Candidatus Woesearchaeota archaeon CG11_big_fil_rev_8_21_14_0_20_43_8]|nr:MAG: imidazole glycerol phosphate synthase subunit HisF [Candidatus Woesearchaeota archaeon CG11_big_fil_rev_8_21_14_0_20_43_8]PIO08826.1 MAG: imidazole glycerol phosphate synthase subunit HisF [Candidatus Woesearchaeota archaeon CG08_land_8_20_14_0_20_43_7]
MLKTRVIPCLLLKGKGLVKSIRFKDHRYIGDPMNAVKIFSEKEVHELVFLDITASKEGKRISTSTVADIADECYMPFAVGGGIKTIEDIHELLNNGAEKVSINTAAIENPGLIKEASRIFGNQSILVSIDAKKKMFGGYDVLLKGKKTGIDPIKHAIDMEKMGAGEIMITSVDNDGKMEGYDLELVKMVSDAVSVPVIACGGAGSVKDLGDAVKTGNASAVAAGSLFVYHGPRRAVLINFPDKEELEGVFR